MKLFGASVFMAAVMAGCSSFPGHIPPMPRHAFEPRLHANPGVPLLDQSEWEEIKGQFAMHIAFRLEVASRWKVDEVSVELRSNVEANKGRLLNFKKEAGHWMKTKDEEVRVDF